MELKTGGRQIRHLEPMAQQGRCQVSKLIVMSNSRRVSCCHLENPPPEHTFFLATSSPRRTYQPPESTDLMGPYSRYLRWRIAPAELEVDMLGIAGASMAPTTPEDDPYRSIQVHDFTRFKFVNR